MDDFNYYSFVLNEEEKIYYTKVMNNSKLEILEWAEQFNFVKREEFEKCANVRQISKSEVIKRNKELYKRWWENHKSDNPMFFNGIPPTIGEAQLD